MMEPLESTVHVAEADVPTTNNGVVEEKSQSTDQQDLGNNQTADNSNKDQIMMEPLESTVHVAEADVPATNNGVVEEKSTTQQQGLGNNPTADNSNKDQILSKRQQKKLLKRQKWNESKVARRKYEREKLKQKKMEKKAAGEPCGNIRKKLKQITMANSSCQQRVIVDMSFDDLMIDRHLNQCVKQISRCYSANRRVSEPLQFTVTSFEGKCAEVMKKQRGYEKWDVYFKSEKYTDLFPKEDIVYLTSESNNVLETLDVKKVYVIGGLVDHNLHKGLCLKLAQENGISHGRLPIEEFIEMKTRKVLTIDHVFRILLGITEGKSWKEVCLDAIPARKGAVGKDDQDEDGEESEGEKIDVANSIGKWLSTQSNV